jgi:hypothetical protein
MSDAPTSVVHETPDTVEPVDDASRRLARRIASK